MIRSGKTGTQQTGAQKRSGWGRAGKKKAQQGSLSGSKAVLAPPLFIFSPLTLPDTLPGPSVCPVGTCTPKGLMQPEWISSAMSSGLSTLDLHGVTHLIA